MPEVLVIQACSLSSWLPETVYRGTPPGPRSPCSPVPQALYSQLCADHISHYVKHTQQYGIQHQSTLITPLRFESSAVSSSATAYAARNISRILKESPSGTTVAQPQLLLYYHNQQLLNWNPCHCGASRIIPTSLEPTTRPRCYLM